MPDENDRESLLAEYKIAHEKHEYYGRTVWQIGSIVITASLVGFGYGLEKNFSVHQLIFLNSVLTLLLIFFSVSAISLRRLAFLCLSRCEEIETILPMKLATYQEKSYKNELNVAGHKIKQPRITGKHLNILILPLGLIAVYWLFALAKHLSFV